MKKDNLHAKLVELDEKISELDNRLMAARAIRSYKSLKPQEAITKEDFRFIPPIVRRGVSVSDVIKNIKNRSEYLEYAKKLESGKSTAEYYMALKKLKGLHPEEFNEPEFISIREKFEELPKNVKERLAPEISKLWGISISNEYSTVVFNYTIDKALKKIESASDKPVSPSLKVVTPIETPIQKTIKEEWISKGFISAEFMKQLYTKFPEADIPREIQSFAKLKKLSEYMVEPIPRELLTTRRRS
ncbi:MAG: hypothetical protein J7L23_00720 [Candidatus Diapherotrites archaeon]|nr:hypothetical protein [Candidatus Diapherotrites archaeon]